MSAYCLFLPPSWVVKGLLSRQDQEMKAQYTTCILNVSPDSPSITEHPAVQTLPLPYTSCVNVILIYLRWSLTGSMYGTKSVHFPGLHGLCTLVHLCKYMSTHFSSQCNPLERFVVNISTSLLLPLFFQAWTIPTAVCSFVLPFTPRDHSVCMQRSLNTATSKHKGRVRL